MDANRIELRSDGTVGTFQSQRRWIDLEHQDADRHLGWGDTMRAEPGGLIIRSVRTRSSGRVSNRDR